MRFRIYRLLLGSTVLILILSATALAQVITGDVLGTVTDPSGAVVANAKITIRNVATNASRDAQSGANGEYVFNLLPPGHYSLTVEGPGFKSYKIDDLSLSAGDRSRVDVALQVGNTSESVEVTSAAPLLQTDSSSVGSSITEETVSNIPLNGRNITNLVTQQVGVNAGMPGNITEGARPDDRRQTSSVSANGQREYLNANVLDGIDNNERFYGLGGIKPSIDAIQEVRVETNSLSADTGRAGGAAVTILTKSGANKFHGTLYEFFRNDIFDAKDAFTPQTGKKSEWRQNQYGGSISGPIIKDKTFFFFDIEQLRLVQGVTSPQQVVPSQADRALVASLPASPGTAVFGLYPVPNVPGNDFAAGCNDLTGPSCIYISNPAKTQNSTSMDVRLDHHFSANDTIFARYSYNPVTSFFPPFFPAVNGVQAGGAGFIANGAFPGSNQTTAQGGQINYTHIFNSRLLMNARVGFLRLNIDSEPIGKGTNGGTKLGIPNTNLANDPNATGTPGFHFLDGSADLGDQIAYPIKNINNSYQINGDLIYTHGQHNLKFGAAFIRRQVNYLQEFTPQGWFFFLNVIPGQTAPVEMAEGIPAVFVNRQNMYSREYLRSSEPSLYVQDDWRATPRLTLNLGLRYDTFTPFSDAKGHYANFDLKTLAIVTGGSGGVSTDHKDFAPRLGFAAQLHGFVLRGGFGLIFYPGDYSSTLTLFNPPYNNPVSCSPIGGSCADGSGFLQTGPPLSPPFVDPSIIYSPNAGGLTLVAKQPNWRASYLEQFNLVLQKQIGANAVTLGYVGSLGRRQNSSAGADQNLPVPDANGNITLVGGAAPHYYATQLPGISQIQYFANEYTANYNAMQLSFDRRFSKGLAFNGNYTWSHGLNTWSGYESGGAPGQWRNNPAYDYGNSDLDVRHRIAVTATYDLPFAKSQKGIEAALLSRWTLSGSAYWQTGLPFTVVDSDKPGGAYGDFNESVRTNVLGQSYYAPNKSINGWLNRAAFPPAWCSNPSSNPACPANNQTLFTLGNQRTNQVFGPHQREVDLSLYKNFPIKEALNMQFRAECYNISNTPNLAQPVNDINASTFGQIQNVTFNTFPRVWQFALKLNF